MLLSVSGGRRDETIWQRNGSEAARAVVDWCLRGLQRQARDSQKINQLSLQRNGQSMKQNPGRREKAEIY